MCDDHHFKDKPLFYRFTLDDGNGVKDRETRLAIMLSVRVYFFLHHTIPPMITDKTYHLRTYPRVFVASELLDWLIDHKLCESREDALAFACTMFYAGTIKHCIDQHFFKDDYLFFQFSHDLLLGTPYFTAAHVCPYARSDC